MILSGVFSILILVQSNLAIEIGYGQSFSGYYGPGFVAELFIPLNDKLDLSILGGSGIIFAGDRKVGISLGSRLYLQINSRYPNLRPFIEASIGQELFYLGTPPEYVDSDFSSMLSSVEVFGAGVQLKFWRRFFLIGTLGISFYGDWYEVLFTTQEEECCPGSECPVNDFVFDVGPMIIPVPVVNVGVGFYIW